MYIADAHCDSLKLMADGGSRELINSYNFSKKYPQLQLAAVFCGRGEENGEQSYNRAKRYITAFQAALKAHSENCVFVRSYSDIERARNEKKHGFMFTAEGAGKAILYKREILSDLYLAGARVIGLTWESNALAKSNRLLDGEADTGFSELGKDVLREINSLGMIVDVSHLSDKSFYDAAYLSDKPIVATHSNFRSVCPHTRNLTDAMAALIFEKDGMVGLNLYPPFISETKEKQTVDGLFEHLDYALSLGGENHIGFGGDIDGTSGRYPYPLDERSSMHDMIIEQMLRHNYSEALVKKVAGENWINYFKKYL